MNYFFVGLGGIMGSLLRYFVSFIQPYTNTPFPFSTLIVNLVGCFLLGWLTKVFANKNHLPEHLVLAVNTGIIGSFTTLSTFSVDIVRLLRDQHILFASIYMLISLVGGFLFAKLGYQLGEKHSSRNERGESNA